MDISVKSLFEVVVIVMIVKLIVSKYQPPLQESLQAIICILVGTIIGLLIDPSVEGFTTAIISSGVGFYGEELWSALKSNNLGDAATISTKLNKNK
jgi:hypothetical protein|nr:MAG TPA: Protein of unknown function (DUF1043) [Caudoviricetes sp.]